MSNSNNNSFANLAGDRNINKGIQMSDLFTDNNPSGYFSRAELNDYIEGIGLYQARKLSLFFEYMSEGYPISSLPIPMEDRATGTEILWVRFKTPTGPLNFKMKHHDWILTLVKHYISGVFKGVRFNTDHIVEELLIDSPE